MHPLFAGRTHCLVCRAYRLKLREMLMPEVVSQVEAGNPLAAQRGSNGAPAGWKTWRVSPDLFPCELSAEVSGVVL